MNSQPHFREVSCSKFFAQPVKSNSLGQSNLLLYVDVIVKSIDYLFVQRRFGSIRREGLGTLGPLEVRRVFRGTTGYCRSLKAEQT